MDNITIMKPLWTNLRGADLSAYAASPNSKNQKGAFVRHVRKHGSPTDFNNFIAQKYQPIEKCVEYYADFPQAAHNWLINNLNASANKGNTHYLTAYFVLSNISNMQHVKEPLEEIINRIQLDTIDVHDHKILLPLWISNGFKNVVKTHWSIYEQLVRDDLVANPMASIMYTAEGMDLEAEVGWVPQSTQQYLEHFISCCSGGLLHRVKQYPIAQNQTGALLHAFYLAALKSHSSVMEYLWDTHPTAPWYKAESVLMGIDKLSPHMADKFMQYMKTNSPRFNQQIFLALNSSIVRKRKKAVELLFAHMPPSLYHQILPAVVVSKNTKMFEHILSHPDGEKQFLKALGGMTDEHTARAHSMRNAVQHRLLNDHTKECKKGKSLPKRKM